MQRRASDRPDCSVFQFHLLDVLVLAWISSQALPKVGWILCSHRVGLPKVEGSRNQGSFSNMRRCLSGCQLWPSHCPAWMAQFCRACTASSTSHVHSSAPCSSAPCSSAFNTLGDQAVQPRSMGAVWGACLTGSLLLASASTAAADAPPSAGLHAAQEALKTVSNSGDV